MEEQKVERPHLEELTVEKLETLVGDIERRRKAKSPEVHFASFASDHFTHIKSLKSLLEVYPADTAEKFLDKAKPYVQQEGIGTTVPTPGTNITTNLGQWFSGLGTYETMFQRQLQMVRPLTSVVSEFRYDNKESRDKFTERMVEHLAKAICRAMVEPWRYYLFAEPHSNLEKAGPGMSACGYSLALDARIRECAIQGPGAADMKPSGSPAEVRLTFSDLAPKIRVSVRSPPSSDLASSPFLPFVDTFSSRNELFSFRKADRVGHPKSSHETHRPPFCTPSRLCDVDQDKSIYHDFNFHYSGSNALLDQSDGSIPDGLTAPSKSAHPPRPISFIPSTSQKATSETSSQPKPHSSHQKGEGAGEKPSTPILKRQPDQPRFTRPEKRFRADSKGHGEKTFKPYKPTPQPKPKPHHEGQGLPKVVCPHCGEEEPKHRFFQCPRKDTATDMAKMSRHK